MALLCTLSFGLAFLNTEWICAERLSFVGPLASQDRLPARMIVRSGQIFAWLFGGTSAIAANTFRIAAELFLQTHVTPRCALLPLSIPLKACHNSSTLSESLGISHLGRVRCTPCIRAECAPCYLSRLVQFPDNY